MKLSLQTSKQREVVDITALVESNTKAEWKLVHVFVSHTTCAITTADLDSGGTDDDYLTAIKAMTPAVNFKHPHDPQHMPDHLWASFIGPDVTIPVEDGNLQLGTWQRIVLIELSGPRQRTIVINGFE